MKIDITYNSIVLLDAAICYSLQAVGLYILYDTNVSTKWNQQYKQIALLS